MSCLALVCALSGCRAARLWETGYEEYKPAPLQPPKRSWKPRPVSVRIHADQEYRAATIYWRDHVQKMVEHANALVIPYGIRFEIVELSDWTRDVAMPRERTLDDLTIHDPGAGVDVVVGLVAPALHRSTEFTRLAAASVFTKHFFVHGIGDLHDLANLDDALLATDAKVLELYEKRIAHQHGAVFVHEWAHTRGAVHVGDPSCFMHAHFSVKVARFCSFSRRILHSAMAQPEAYHPQGQLQRADALLDLVTESTRGIVPGTAETTLRSSLLEAREQWVQGDHSINVAEVTVLSPDDAKHCRHRSVLEVPVTYVGLEPSAEEWAMGETLIREAAAKGGSRYLRLQRGRRGSDWVLAAVTLRCASVEEAVQPRATDE